MIIAHRESFTKSSVFKMFSFHTKPPVWRAFTKSSFFVTDSLTDSVWTDGLTIEIKS